MRLILVQGTKDNESRRKIGDYDSITECMLTIDNYLTIHKQSVDIKRIKEEAIPFTLTSRIKVDIGIKGKWFYIEGYTRTDLKRWKSK